MNSAWFIVRRKTLIKITFLSIQKESEILFSANFVPKTARHIFVGVYVYIYTYIYVYTYMCIYLYMYINKYLYTNIIRKYIYTHIFICWQSNKDSSLLLLKTYIYIYKYNICINKYLCTNIIRIFYRQFDERSLFFWAKNVDISLPKIITFQQLLERKYKKNRAFREASVSR